MPRVDRKTPALSDDTIKKLMDKKAENKQDYTKIEKQLFDSVKQSEEDLLRSCKEKFRVAADARKRFDWEWLSRDLFRRGYMFSKYNSQNKTVVMTSTNTTRIPINLTASAMRSIRNQVIAFQPKWEVLPTNADEQSKLNAKYSGKTLDFVFLQKRLRKMIKETVTQGLLFSVGGAWQTIWDSELANDDGSKGWIQIWLTDPFDFYVDPNCTDGLTFSDAEYVIKAVRKPIVEVKNNPNYKNTDKIIHGEERLAVSESKQFLLQALRSNASASTREGDTETIILKEGEFKERGKDGKIRTRIVTWVDGVSLPLQNKIINVPDYSYRMYQADINPLEIYGEGWARHVIPINRVLNALESSIFDYNYKYAKGRLVVDKNAGIRVITNEHGSIIEKNRGTDVHSLPLQPLPNDAESQIGRLRMYFEDISGVHDASLGRIPSGVKSGIGIAELKQADATNQADLSDALADFLIEVGKKVLKEISLNLKFPQLVKSTDITGKADYFAIIGEKAASGRKSKVRIGKQDYPLVVIAENNTIRVTIGSWLAYSKAQRQQELKDLYSTGVIDQRTLLENLEFGDVDMVIERTKKEALLKKRRDLQSTVSNEVTEEELAIAENELMLEGNPNVMAQPQDDHEVHLIVHEEAKDNKLVAMHIQEHLMLSQKKEETAGVIPPPVVGQAPNAGAAVPPPPPVETAGAAVPTVTPAEVTPATVQTPEMAQ